MMLSLMGLMLPVIILSGFIFPINSMPLPMQVISNIIPAKWFIIIVKAIMLKRCRNSIYMERNTYINWDDRIFYNIEHQKYKIRLE